MGLQSELHYLLDPLPTSLNINGVEYPIQSDFRAVLFYDRILRQGDHSRDDNAAATIAAITYLLGSVPDNAEETVTQIDWFISCGITDHKHKPSNQLLGINNEKPIDWKYDSRLIWSAFRRVYGVDLREVKYLHWWDFNEMLAELPEDVRLNRIIEIRTKSLADKNLNKEQKNLYKALQGYYRITEPKSEREEKIAEALKRGEDPAPYL